MVSLNKSFLYGICVASITWLISLYLYFELTSHENVAQEIPIYHPIPMSGNSLDFWNFKKKHISSRNSAAFKHQSSMLKDLDELGMVGNEDEEQIKEKGYKEHAFNVLLSNKIGPNREVPDTRYELCRSIVYFNKLTSSIIICFYNEHLTTLLRTVQSIVSNSFSTEILLIDDYSDIPNLLEDIKKYFKVNYDFEYRNISIKFFRTERREGLIRARIFGARRATGEVLVFLDSHVEVNQDWLDPLLSRIRKNYTNVVMPIIDIINPDTFVYTASPLVRGGFNWGLHFKWDNLPKGVLVTKEDFVKPIKSPTMAGGLFAISKKYFEYLGEYDAGMNIWGGENLEISFRIWMCGGNLELVPCSRVGHVFRHRRPYSSPDGQDTMLYNSLRVAHVWMDDYKKYYINNDTEKLSADYGDISSRVQLRKELKCKSFDWYIKNVYPELTLPNDDEKRLKEKWSTLEQNKFQPWHSRKRNYVNSFQIRLSNSTLCVQSKGEFKTKGSKLMLKTCLKSKAQLWSETDKHELVLAKLLCLQSDKPSPILYKCHEMSGDQEWKHMGGIRTPVYNLGAGTCLAAKRKEIGSPIIMKLCTDPELSMWDLVQV